MIALTFLLAFVPCPAAQTAPAPQRRNPVLDGVAIQAGESIVTFGELERAIKRVRERRPPDSREEEERMRAEILISLWNLRVEEQAGTDLGLDPEQIERMSRAVLADERERAGLQAYLADLRDQGKDVLSDESNRQEELRRILWERSRIGMTYGAQRASRDLDVRPGELRAIYAENKERMKAGTVQLRLLIVSSEAAGSPEAARASCEEARQQVLSGQDLALFVEDRGAAYRESHGLLPFTPPGGLRDPALVAFAEKAEIGDLSEVVPFTNPQTGKPAPELGYQFAEMNDRRAANIPEFDSTDVQAGLRKQIVKQRQDLILDRERTILRRDCYSWLSPLIVGDKTPAKPTTPPSQ